MTLPSGCAEKQTLTHSSLGLEEPRMLSSPNFPQAAAAESVTAWRCGWFLVLVLEQARGYDDSNDSGVIFYQLLELCILCQGTICELSGRAIWVRGVHVREGHY